MGRQNVRRNPFLIDSENWKFRRDHASVAVRRNDAERTLPGHQLRVSEVGCMERCQSWVSEIGTSLTLPTEHTASERIDPCELVVRGLLHRHIYRPLGEQLF